MNNVDRINKQAKTHPKYKRFEGHIVSSGQNELSDVVFGLFLIIASSGLALGAYNEVQSKTAYVKSSNTPMTRLKACLSDLPFHMACILSEHDSRQ